MKQIVPGRRYTSAEMAELRDTPELAGMALQGYVLRANDDGTMQFVHWTKATGGGGTFNGKPARPGRGYTATEDPWGDLPPIVKRTPQQRVDSLMVRFIEDCRKTGTVPGLSDARISAILGYTKNTNRDGVTAEDIRRIAQHFLTNAESKREDDLSRRVTRSDRS